MDPHFVTQAYGGTAAHTAGTYDYYDFGASQTGFEGTQSRMTQGLGADQVLFDDATLKGRAGNDPSTSFVAEEFSKLRFEETTESQEPEPAPPSEACAYCGIHNSTSLVKSVKVGKWFCNGRVNGTASCIITHLVKSKHRACQLHPTSAMQDMLLECYVCGSTNVFSLGFVPVKGQSSVVLLCREPHTAPAEKSCLRDLDLDRSLWKALVQDRALCSWLVHEPPEQDVRKAKKMKVADINALEEAWKINPNVKLEELKEESAAEALPTIQMQYEDGVEYQNVMARLIKEEADTDRKAKEAQARSDVTIEWLRGLNNKPQAKLNFPRDTYDLRLMTGDELRLKHTCAGVDHRKWEATGVVVRLEETSEKVVLELRGKETPPWNTTVGFTVEFLWRSTSFDRMQSALKTLVHQNTSLSNYLYESLLGKQPETKELGHKLPANLSAPGLPELNHSQAMAVRTAVQNPLALIQGPPGTGKTVTAATIIYHLAQQEEVGRKRKAQILVAAPSNVAVDQLAEKAEAAGLRVVRLSARARESIASPVQHLTLHYQVANADVKEWKELRALQQLRQEVGELSAADENKLAQLRSQAERLVLEAADVVCCTCVTAGDPRLNNMRFHRVVLDESTQATEAESLIPIVKGAKQVVLIGDHCQLGPVIISPLAAKAGLGTSLFERLVALGHKPSRLAVQYRMHPALSRFPSDTFYEGALQNGVTAAQRSWGALNFPWPAPTRPTMFYSQTGHEEISPSGTSYLNRTEAMVVEKLVTYLLGKGIKPEQIGVITPYEGQRVHIMATMLGTGMRQPEQYSHVEVSSVDAFQGREKDFIIVSCVRASEKQGIGFLGDPRRLNVALTRAKYGLVLIGNPKVLSQHDLWKRLLTHYKEQGALVEGPLNNLKASYIQLSRPSKAFDSQRFAIGGAASSRFATSSKPEARTAATSSKASSSQAPDSSRKGADAAGPSKAHQLPLTQPLYAITQDAFATQAVRGSQGLARQADGLGTAGAPLFTDIGLMSQGGYGTDNMMFTQGTFLQAGTQF